MSNAPLLPDYFSLFGLEPKFEIDLLLLKNKAREVLRQVHPDRFVLASAQEKSIAQQWAAHVHQALECLQEPAARAMYLCQLHGVNNVGNDMPMDFLQRQMDWHERIEQLHEGADASKALLALEQQIASERENWIAQLQALLDTQHDYPRAVQLARAGSFFERIEQQLKATHGQAVDA